MTTWLRATVTASALIVTLAAGGAAPVGASDVPREIDRQVWIPLLAASNQFDAEGFLAVQSADLVRVSVDTSEIYGLDRYRRELVEGFARARERGIRRQSEVRFLTRTHSGGLARDTGVFRSEVVLAGGETRVRYTAFEMILRLEDGRWRILVDQDTARGGSISEAEYLAGTPLQRDPIAEPATKLAPAPINGASPERTPADSTPPARGAARVSFA